ncbi:nitrate regulatory protein [Motiliproteus sediminis]|uniref:nitrate regulatory protein n=1 Tax=Motiliproteus sediminis TaxID=1468178 RepID=UPI001AEFA86F|nr:nitrate regulatory protein [Motiliproteus sediminis]
MQSNSQATEQFLLAAKHAEIHTLEQLAASCEVVTEVSGLIHQLQRERGISNIFLASAGARFAEQRAEQITHCLQSEKALRQLLNVHYLGAKKPPGSMRLLNSIAFVLQGLDNLAELRRQVDQQEISALDSTRALCRLIAGLLSVVFEAADIASDPVVTRVLVALFNLMQGKEYAGQERAWAAIGFAAGRFDEATCNRLSHLQDAQQRSFELVVEFAPGLLVTRWQTLEESGDVADLGRLRELIRGLCRGEPIAPELSEVWYELATRRIDQMRELEILLAEELARASQQQLAQAEANLQAHRDRLQALATIETPTGSPLTMLFDPDAPGLYGADGTDLTPVEQAEAPDLARSVYDLVRGQAEHIKRMGEELSDARRALTERKQIERAKGLLMQNFNLTEEQAYRRMQQRAMELNTRLAEVAETLIAAAERVR